MLSNALNVKEMLEIVPLVFMVPSPSMDLVLSFVVKMNSASKDSVLPALLVAMVALTTLKTVSLVLLDTSKLVQFVKKDVFLINSSTRTKKDALLVDPAALLVHPTVNVLPAKTLLLLLEEESAPTVPTPVQLVMELELALPVSADSSTSKEPAKHHVPLELTQSTEFADVLQELSV